MVQVLHETSDVPQRARSNDVSEAPLDSSEDIGGSNVGTANGLNQVLATLWPMLLFPYNNRMNISSTHTYRTALRCPLCVSRSECERVAAAGLTERLGAVAVPHPSSLPELTQPSSALDLQQ